MDELSILDDRIGERMRDPTRIPWILERLGTVWDEHPDLRLGQLIENVAGYEMKDSKYPLYYMEDEELMDVDSPEEQATRTTGNSPTARNWSFTFWVS